jgi:hypothetical protein
LSLSKVARQSTSASASQAIEVTLRPPVMSGNQTIVTAR